MEHQSKLLQTQARSVYGNTAAWPTYKWSEKMYFEKSWGSDITMKLWEQF